MGDYMTAFDGIDMQSLRDMVWVLGFVIGFGLIVRLIWRFTVGR